MKKTLVILFLVLVASFAFGSGVPDISGEHLVLAIENELNVDNGDGTFTVYYQDYVVKEFIERYGVEVDIVPVHSDDNTEKRIKAMVYAGLTPNVYTDYAGRVGIFVAERLHVMALDQYLPKEVIDQYFPSYIEMFSTEGHVRALPLTAWASVGHINKTAFDLAGMPEVGEEGHQVTYAEVYKAAKILKDQGYYATPMHASQAGGDYWTMTYWLSGFGAKLYDKNGNIALGTPEALHALLTMKQWYDEGLIPFGAAGLGPGDYISELSSGSCLTFSYGNAPYNFGDIINIQTTTPRMPGVELVPVAVGPDAVLAFDVGTKRQKYAAAALVQHLASAEYQQFNVSKRMRFPSMFGVELPENPDPNFVDVIEVLEKNGVLDVGIGKPYYTQMRLQWAVMLQAIFSDELPVKEAMLRYISEGTAIIEASRDEAARRR